MGVPWGIPRPQAKAGLHTRPWIHILVPALHACFANPYPLSPLPTRTARARAGSAPMTALHTTKPPTPAPPAQGTLKVRELEAPATLGALPVGRPALPGKVDRGPCSSTHSEGSLQEGPRGAAASATLAFPADGRKGHPPRVSPFAAAAIAAPQQQATTPVPACAAAPTAAAAAAAAAAAPDDWPAPELRRTASSSQRTPMALKALARRPLLLLESMAMSEGGRAVSLDTSVREPGSPGELSGSGGAQVGPLGPGGPRWASSGAQVGLGGSASSAGSIPGGARTSGVDSTRVGCPAAGPGGGALGKGPSVRIWRQLSTSLDMGKGRWRALVGTGPACVCRRRRPGMRPCHAPMHAPMSCAHACAHVSCAHVMRPCVMCPRLYVHLSSRALVLV